MAAADVQSPPEEAAPALPDYLTSPNAVLGDKDAQWRYGRAPDYSKTRKVWADSKQADHVAGSLPQLVENLVKNWEVEASFKTNLSDWRTIDHANYTFAINGGPPQSAEHMLKVGTYNAIIAPNEYYSPANSDFASSHKTFKRMMPTFAWEVLEVYSGPPKVSFRWRHWGTMKNDYVGFNDKGEKITAKAHGGQIDITGVTVATVDDKVRLQAVDTYFDPLDMFRQIAPHGIVNKETVDHKVDRSAAMDTSYAPSNDGVKIAENNHDEHAQSTDQPTPTGVSSLPDRSQAKEKADDAIPSVVLPDTERASAKPEAQKDESEAHDGPSESFHDAQEIVDTAASLGTAAKVEHVPSNRAPTAPVTGRSHSSSQSSGSAWEKVSHPDTTKAENGAAGQTISSSSVTGVVDVRADADKIDYDAQAGARDEVDEHLESSAEKVHPHPHTMEEAVRPAAGEAVAVNPHSEEAMRTYEEMSRVTPVECPFLMNRE